MEKAGVVALAAFILTSIVALVTVTVVLFQAPSAIRGPSAERVEEKCRAALARERAGLQDAGLTEAEFLDGCRQAVRDPM